MNKYILLIFSLLIFSSTVYADFLDDDLMKESLQYDFFVLPDSNTNYNYESLDRVPIKIRISESISTKRDELYDGMPLEFIVVDDVIYDGEVIINKDEIVNGKIMTFTTKDMNGIPARIVIDKLKIDNIDENKMTTSFSVYGKSFMPVVMPIKWILTPFPPLNTLTNPIHGTNVKLSSKKIITLYYYPNRNQR